jgi:hypothetical protein
MRTALLLIPLLLAGCGRPTGDPEPEMRTIDCALAGSDTFVPHCRVEQAGSLLVVHRPDGGFRRLRKVTDGRGVVAADGVEPARVAWIADGRLEVALGQDRYRFPAKVRADNAPAH